MKVEPIEFKDRQPGDVILLHPSVDKWMRLDRDLNGRTEDGGIAVTKAGIDMFQTPETKVVRLTWEGQHDN